MKEIGPEEEIFDEIKNNELINFYTYLRLVIFLILTLIGLFPNSIDRLIEKIEYELIDLFSKSIYEVKIPNIEKDPNFEYFCCFCSMGKEENLYIKEIINYYQNIGVDKFIIGDNNFQNGEKFSDVIQDYINKGIVDIKDIRGIKIKQEIFFSDVYNEYKKKCKWMTFFDFDEYLVMFNKEGKHISLLEFLNKDFDNCENILINWLMYGDDGYIYYNNKPTIKRFRTPDFNNYANVFEKSIVRGNLKQTIFGKDKSNHIANPNLKLCNSLGKNPNSTKHLNTLEKIKNAKALLMHFNTKSAEEYAKKIERGYPNYFIQPLSNRMKMFFTHNKLTRKKIKFFEKYFHTYLHKEDKFRKITLDFS